MIKLAHQQHITIGEKYGPAMEMTDPVEAAAYFGEMVNHTLSYGEVDKARAIDIEKQNLGYYAGYYDHETRLRVEKLFCCTHPVFGAAAEGFPTQEEAFKMGEDLAEKDNT